MGGIGVREGVEDLGSRRVGMWCIGYGVGVW